MGSQEKFHVGLYLTDYIMYQWDDAKQFPQEYLNFLKQELGIEWKLTRRESS